MAVQNQTGRFPNKWDKTGTVVENMEYDKVLVKLDGSGRLTTRNRRFVKKIISPPDLPNVDMPVVRANSDIGGSKGEDLLPGNVVDTVDPIGREELHSSVDGRDDISEEVNPITSVDVPGQTVQPVVSSPAVQPTPRRSGRIRKPNVRYSAEEYDLSKVSGTKKVITNQGWKKARRRKLSP